MQTDPRSFFTCISDAFTQVRSAEGQLLGCIPAIPEGADKVFTQPGQQGIDVSLGVIRGVILPAEGIDPRDIPGFIPYDGAVKAGLVEGPTIRPGEDPDLAEAP